MPEKKIILEVNALVEDLVDLAAPKPFYVKPKVKKGEPEPPPRSFSGRSVLMTLRNAEVAKLTAEKLADVKHAEFGLCCYRQAPGKYIHVLVSGHKDLDVGKIAAKFGGPAPDMPENTDKLATFSANYANV